jgi:hypothetical protein
MKSSIQICLVLLTSVSCNSVKINNTDNSYAISNIEKNNNWYVIHAFKNDSLFKIVLDAPTYDKCEKKIQIGKDYSLNLKSFKSILMESGNSKFIPVNYLDIRCKQFDEQTTICFEPEKKNYDLYFIEGIDVICR